MKKKNTTAVVDDGAKRDCEVLALVLKKKKKMVLQLHVAERRSSTSEVSISPAVFVGFYFVGTSGLPPSREHNIY